MSISTVAVTGGNRKIGRSMLNYLKDEGYETANIARGKRREDISDIYITTDLMDAGETYSALSKAGADAVIHLGTIPDPYSNPQFRTYESNTTSAVHILEASEALDLKSCCLASSINAMGAEHQQRPPQVEYLPIDEQHPRTPDDIYGIAKYAMEVTAAGFGRRPDTDLTISTLRYPWVPTEEELIEAFVEEDRSLNTLRDDEPWTGRDVMFSYIHIDDACRIAENALTANYSGHESFWAVADDTTAAVPTAKLVAEFFPQVDRHTHFEGCETLFDISKADDLLDWSPRVRWREY
jgi:nucleoside-diphosphate-sugar epimerase